MRATPNTPLAYWPLAACLLLAALLFAWQPSRELSAALVAAAWLGLRVFDGLSTARFQRLVILVAIVGATFLLVRQL